MIYLLNRNKIFSCVIACSFVLMLFTFYDKVIPNRDVELVKVTSNVINNNDDIDYTNEKNKNI